MLFNELTREEIVPRLREATLRAPSLIGFEVANACLKKIRAAPAEREALLEAFSLFDALSISLEAVNLDAAIVLAERMKLSLYDASYLWLARALSSLTGSLSRLIGRSLPKLRSYASLLISRRLHGVRIWRDDIRDIPARFIWPDGLAIEPCTLQGTGNGAYRVRPTSTAIA